MSCVMCHVSCVTCDDTRDVQAVPGPGQEGYPRDEGGHQHERVSTTLLHTSNVILVQSLPNSRKE